jgi:hypothetical protein
VANGAASGAFALSDGPLKAFMDKTAALSVADRGRALAGYAELQEMSDATAASGETDGAGTDDAQGQHFIAFVRVGEVLYEVRACRVACRARCTSPRPRRSTARCRGVLRAEVRSRVATARRAQL